MTVMDDDAHRTYGHINCMPVSRMRNTGSSAIELLRLEVLSQARCAEAGMGTLPPAAAEWAGKLYRNTPVLV